ncbi:MGMT family protein [Luteipulveratus mongoliensis]|uniref:Cysteine methyltransferase n=1 Tax=Luteipulveratus mongoliensis TaxID=571913 RepID=A0A0K1JLM7_9MICO|nr:MGMT family protein [Luteipulveratus mongoliensis]AKU17616.1 cysteine methyltransferase [Luteipulveratus mongoliensis]
MGDDDHELLEELPELADLVLAIVDQIPEGRVVTYGDIAAVAGSGPRQVGSVMSGYGSMVAWWRVLRADGRPPQGHEDEAIAHYREEDTPMRNGRVDLRRARFPLDEVEGVRPA